MENRAKGIRSSVRPLTNSEVSTHCLGDYPATWLAFRFVFDPRLSNGGIRGRRPF